jgi:non-heme chloroperoxidase
MRYLTVGQENGRTVGQENGRTVGQENGRTVGQENGRDVQICYLDHGAGPAVVLVHGYLADAHAWQLQEPVLLDAGYRVISYDQRGSGFSSATASGYDFDTLSADLSALLEELDIRDAVLVGFSSGTGQVIRYLARYAPGRVRAAALLAPMPPSPSRPYANPGGVESGFPDGFLAELTADRAAAIRTFLDLAYNLDLLGGTEVSDQAWWNSFHTAMAVSPAAAVGCIMAWREDFREDLARISVPALIMQGSQDRVMPSTAGPRLAEALPGARLAGIPNGPHAIMWTHAAEVNQALLGFLRALEEG